MHVALVFSTDITGRAIDVDIEWFYVRVWTISSFTVRLTKLLSVFTAKSVAQGYVKKEKGILTDEIERWHKNNMCDVANGLTYWAIQYLYFLMQI